MINGSCHCGAVRLSLAQPPVDVNDCQCDHCQKRGVLWAYYTPDEVVIEGETTRYLWGPRQIAFHFCPTCGCTTHWSPVDPTRKRLGVNVRLFDRTVLAAATIRQSPGPR